MVRPRLRTSLLWQLGIGILILLAALLGRSADILRSLTFIGLLLAITVASVLLSIRNASLRSDGGGLVRVDILGRTTRLPPERLAGGERYSVGGLYGVTRYLVLKGPDSSTLLKLSGNFWNLDEVESLYASIGLVLRGSYDTVRRPASGRAAFDDLSWQQTVVACALILVAVALALFVMAPSSR